jgi:hypothetical protein
MFKKAFFLHRKNLAIVSVFGKRLHRKSNNVVIIQGVPGGM